MNRTKLQRRLSRPEQASAALSAEPEALPPTVPPDDETGALASELASAFSALVRAYINVYKLSAEEAVQRAGESLPPREEQALRGRPEDVSWTDLNCLAQRDPELALRRWEAVKAAAREELRTGFRAARTMEAGASTCWKRARFLAIRTELIEAWQPCDGQERLLIDQLAQAQTLRWEWQHEEAAYAALQGHASKRTLQQGAPSEPPRLSDVEAVEHAAAMVERCQRLFLRALKALQDQRRWAPHMVVERAGQVNIGGQQLNVAGR